MGLFNFRKSKERIEQHEIYLKLLELAYPNLKNGPRDFQLIQDINFFCEQFKYKYTYDEVSELHKQALFIYFLLRTKRKEDFVQQLLLNTKFDVTAKDAEYIHSNILISEQFTIADKITSISTFETSV